MWCHRFLLCGLMVAAVSQARVTSLPVETAWLGVTLISIADLTRLVNPRSWVGWPLELSTADLTLVRQGPWSQRVDSKMNFSSTELILINKALIAGTIMAESIQQNYAPATMLSHQPTSQGTITIKTYHSQSARRRQTCRARRHRMTHRPSSWLLLRRRKIWAATRTTTKDSRRKLSN